jgi:hypothetical protein
MKFNLAVIFLAVLTLNGCAKNTPAVRSPTRDLLNTYAPVVAFDPAPLEEVEVPGRDEPPQGSAYYRLNLGEVAPVAGFLLTDPASAFVITEYEAMTQRFQLALTNQRSRDYARLKLETDTLRLQLNTDRAKFQVILRSYDFEIQDLHNIIKDQNSFFHNLVPMVAVGSVGIVVGFVVGFLVAN